mmetsp:Transcript_19940/g.22815  ORF Transcript_19940/g.22815 Transcript_19940/m.22815 type:complete len:313 (-) Transcript_19940:176-1114(-)
MRRMIIWHSVSRKILSISHRNDRLLSGISVALVKELRERSGAPIVECKNALAKSCGDTDTAMEWLRKQGAAKALSKLSNRDANEGLVGAMVSGRRAAIVQVTSETDFAGRSEEFSGLVEHITFAALESKPSGELIGKDFLSVAVKGKTVREALDNAILSIRENLRITSALKCVVDDGLWIRYVHGRVTDVAGSAAAIVHVTGDASDEILEEVGKKLAMHVVAARPVYLDIDSVPEEEVVKETDFLREQLMEASKKKTPEILEKIIAGKMRKYFENICLTEQAHMTLEGNPKVKEALKGDGIKVTHFELKALH